MNKLRLILGDQLNINHSWFKENDPSVIYVMMEIKDETNYVLHHIQKILATFAAMRFFSKQLIHKGFKVTYIKINEKGNKQSFFENIKGIIETKNIKEIDYQEPDEFRLASELKNLKRLAM